MPHYIHFVIVYVAGEKRAGPKKMLHFCVFDQFSGSEKNFQRKLDCLNTLNFSHLIRGIPEFTVFGGQQINVMLITNPILFMNP